MPLLDPTGGGRGRGARGPAAVDEELGIEDEDYNANYEEEEVGGRARAGGRGGEEPFFSEDDLDQEPEERTGRSRTGNLAKSGKHARSRSVDLLSGNLLLYGINRVYCRNVLIAAQLHCLVY